MARRTFALPLLLGLLLLTFAVPASTEATPREDRTPTSVTLPVAAHSLPVRVSPGGERLAVGLAVAEHFGRGWGTLGVAVFDPATGEEVWRDSTLSPGREMPHFDRAGTRLAWCEPHLVTGEAQPRTPTVLRMVDLASGERTETAVATNPAAEKTTLVALDPDGSHAVLLEEVRAIGDSLVVVDTKTGELGLRFRPLVSVGFGRSGSDVTLTERWLVAHTRAANHHRRAESQLVVVDRKSGEEMVRTGAYVCRLTPRYAISADDQTLWNGTSEFVIESFALPSGERTELGNVRKPLYSHFLELTLSPDERDLVAWSDERKNWVHFVAGETEPRPIALGRSANVWGIDRWGRLWCRGRGTLGTIDLRTPGATWVDTAIGGEMGWFAAGGTVLVTARATRPLGEDGEPNRMALPSAWTLEFTSLEAPAGR